MAMGGTPGAASDLGLDLQQQVQDETEEERKKRQQAQGMAAKMSPGAMSLLGPSMGLTGGGY